MRAQEFVAEAFDQPYPLLRWEKGDFGDVDAIARLDDGTFLSIMFNKGFGKDTKEETWSVEFWRNNSQEVTGEGDQQRVFATVLSAIQQFIDTEHPAHIRFSANKDVDPGQKSQTRSNLYNKLVQRYANSWGYSVDVDDFADTTVYNLYTLHESVAEGKDFDRCFDQACKLYDRAVSKNLEPKLVQVADFQGDGNGADPRWMKLPQHVWQHYVVIVGDQVLDPTAKQFGDSMPTQYQVSDLDRLWGKQYQIRPRQGVAENFADGRVKGKSRPGRVKRSGASCDGSVSDLRSKAKNASGERAKMYHWCANMKSGRKK
jgi:hypothetical protein